MRPLPAALLLPVALLAFLLAGCDAAAEVGGEIFDIDRPGSVDGMVEVPGTIAFYDETALVRAPDTVRAGEPFEVTVYTFGGGCIEPGGVSWVLDGATVIVKPYDYEPSDDEVVCTMELRFLPHAVTLHLRDPGPATLRILGRKKGRGLDEPVPTTLERTIVVE